MTVGTSPTWIDIPGNGTATVFSFPFLITATSDLLVGFIVAGVYTQQSGYAIAGVGNSGGGQVTFSVAPPIGTIVDLRSLMPFTQPTNFANLGPYLPENTTNAVDRATSLIKTLARLTYSFGLHGPDTDTVVWPALPAAPLRANMAPIFDGNGLPTLGFIPNGIFTQSNWDAFLSLTTALFPLLQMQQTPAETSAGVTPVNLGFQPYTPQRLGVKADNVTDDTAAWASNILVAAQTINGAKGATVDATKLTGITKLSSQLIMPNRVRIKGPNASGLIFQATPSHPGPYMFYANNGAISMFDSILEDLYIDCNSVPGLSAIRTDAWQENSGLRSVGIMNCTNYGLRFVNVSAGGQATCEIEQLQLFASATGMTAGIRVDQISSIGSFQLHVRDSVIASAGAPNTTVRGIDIAFDSLLAENCHFECCASGIYLDGNGKHVISHCSGSIDTNVLVHIASTFTGSVTVIGCQRNSSPVLIQNDVTGETINTDVPLYVYPNISSQNTAKGWCFFDGTATGTNAPTSGSNVTSVQRLSTGRYKIALSIQTLNGRIAAFASSNQSASGAREWTQASNAANFLVNLDVAGVPTDATEVHVNFFAQ